MARSEITSTIARSDNGQPLTGVAVEVKTRAGAAATVYSSEAGAALSSNILYSVDGEISGWLDDGSYTLVMTAPDLATRTEYIEAISGSTVVAAVPYTGATTNINIGTHTLTASAGANGEVTVGADNTQGGYIGIYPKVLADNAFSTTVFGDAWDAFAIEARGKLKWGDGTNTWDVNLYRQAADILKTDDHFAISQPSGGSSAALNVTVRGITHGIIASRTEGNPSNGNVLLVTAADLGTDADPQDTTVGISGYETSKGTLKISHNKPVAAVTGSDASASVLSLRANGAGTAAQGIFFDAEQVGGTTGRLMNFRQNGADTFAVDAAGDIVAGGLNTGDWDQGVHAASKVYTMPDLHVIGTVTVTAGNRHGGAAICRRAGTYTKLVFCTSANPTGVTDLRAAVWDSTGTLIVESANLSATVTGSQVYEVSLGAGATLTLGQRVYLGIATVGGNVVCRGAASVALALTATRTGRSFTTLRVTSGYAGGSVGTLSTGGSGAGIIWAELQP